MTHKVKCLYCQQEFDRDSEPYVQVSARRYAHKKCAEEHEKNKTQEERDLEALEAYVMKLFGEPYVNARTKKQIKDFHKEYGYTYSGMLKTLIYWYEIKGNSIEKANGGIGIIPYIYSDASKYYYSLYLAQIANQNKDIEAYKPKVKTISIPRPTTKKKPVKLFFEGDKDG